MPCYSEPRAPQHVFQHSKNLVPRTDDLLKTTRNVGIVGMGGIGKTTIARAVFERARSRFDAAVWLTVGRHHGAMLPLLRTAFAKLFPRCALPFDTAEGGLEDIIQRLCGAGRSVLLVLDNVWPNTQHAVVPALNFATRPGARTDGSRLIVTTRYRDALSYGTSPDGVLLMDELEVVEPPLLNDGSAQQLFNHHAFGSHDAKLPDFVPDACVQLIRTCGGNPLALRVLGSALRDCKTAEQWEQRLNAAQESQARGEDRATRTCADSVEALVPSLKECFVQFAAFPANAQVLEADVLHMFVTLAPLQTPIALQAAANKLNELVNRSLVFREAATEYTLHDSPLYMYYMHDILRSIALGLASDRMSRRSFAKSRPDNPVLIRSFSSHTPDVSESLAAHLRACGDAERMRACVLCHAYGASWDALPPMTRLLYLWLDNDISEIVKMLETTKRAMPWPLLRFLRVSSGDADSVAALLHMLLPAMEPVHLSVRGCTTLQYLPEAIGCCARLTYLDCGDCVSLTRLAEAIPHCANLMHLDVGRCMRLKHLPEAMGSCSMLTHLDLSNCRSLTSLPESIGGCSRLVHLSLAQCERIACLPESIGECSDLARLDLSFCESLHALPASIGGCRKLKHLTLSWCEGLKQIPCSIGECSELSHVDIIGCENLERLPAELSDCHNLAHLSVSECDGLGCLPMRIGDCHKLLYLAFSGCRGGQTERLTHLPDSLGNCTRLVDLRFARCVLVETLPDSISGCQQLQHLKVWGCVQLRGLPEGLGECRQLAHINASDCDNLAHLPESIGRCVALTALELQACEKLEEVPQGIGSCKQLANLDLRGCERLAQLPHSIGGCKQLADLNLSSCKSLAQLPDSLADCSQLVNLNLWGCTKLVRLPEHIGQCGQLVQLNLNACVSLEALPDTIGNCSELTRLDLWGCAGLASLPETISGCRHLALLDLWGCNSLIQVPDGIGDCTRLEHLDVSTCSNLAALPDTIGNCQALRELRAARCTGLSCLPESLSRCLQLQSVDVRGCDPELRRPMLPHVLIRAGTVDAMELGIAGGMPVANGQARMVRRRSSQAWLFQTSQRVARAIKHFRSLPEDKRLLAIGSHRCDGREHPAGRASWSACKLRMSTAIVVTAVIAVVAIMAVTRCT